MPRSQSPPPAAYRTDTSAPACNRPRGSKATYQFDFSIDLPAAYRSERATTWRPVIVAAIAAVTLVSVGVVIVTVSAGFELLNIGSTPAQPVAKPTQAVNVSGERPAMTAPAPQSHGDRLEEARSALGAGDAGRSIELLSSLRNEQGSTPIVDELLYQAYLAHGRTLIGANDLDLSYAIFGEALKLKPDDPSALDGQKQVVLIKNSSIVQRMWATDPDAAISALEDSMRFDPEYDRTREWLYSLLVQKSERLLQAGERSEGVAALIRAIEVDPDRPEARQRLTALTPTPLPTPTRVPATPIPTRIPSTPVPARPPVSLTNGAYLTPPRYQRGLGSLTIRNGTSDDAVAKLKEDSSQRTVATIYVRAGGTVVLESIGVGTYVLQFMTGQDWSAERGVFLQNIGALQFREDFVYRETSTRSGTQYATFEVTLNRVVGGTAATDRIDPATFARD